MIFLVPLYIIKILNFDFQMFIANTYKNITDYYTLTSYPTTLLSPLINSKSLFVDSLGFPI